MEHILNLARPTFGDANFYERWKRLGQVYQVEPINYKDITVLVVDQRTEVTTETLRRYPSVRLVCSATTGHTHLKFTPSQRLRLITLKGHTDFLRDIRSVSEFTIALMLNLIRGPTATTKSLLFRKTILILGYGRIGKQVSSLAMAFGMKQIIVDKDNAKELDELLPQADFVSVHVDENPSTLDLISDKRIRAMKKGSYLINTARPSIVDGNSAVRAVMRGHLSGLACDFKEQISYPHGYNILATSHIAGHTLEDRIKTDEYIVSKAMEFLGT